jgi:hypothetical protein
MNSFHYHYVQACNSNLPLQVREAHYELYKFYRKQQQMADQYYFESFRYSAKKIEPKSNPSTAYTNLDKSIFRVIVEGLKFTADKLNKKLADAFLPIEGRFKFYWI